MTGGFPPYNFYVCDEYGNNCSLLGTSATTYNLNPFYSTAETLLIKVVDSNLCEFFTIVSCPPEVNCVILTEDGNQLTTEDGYFLVFCDT